MSVDHIIPDNRLDIRLNGIVIVTIIHIIRKDNQVFLRKHDRLEFLVVLINIHFILTVKLPFLVDILGHIKISLI